MKNTIKIIGIIAFIAVIGFSMSGCAMLSTIGASAEPHGIISGNGSTGKLVEGAQEVASYTVLLNLIDSGYEDYAAKVKAAEKSGKQVYTVTKWMLIMLKVTAYAK